MIVWGIKNMSNLLTSIGLLFDICGVLLVSYTVLWPYKVPDIIPGEAMRTEHLSLPAKTKRKEDYEESNRKIAYIGISLIVSGYLLQFFAVWF